jgi:hypothetical protein
MGKWGVELFKGFKVFKSFKVKGLYGKMYFLQLPRRGLYGRDAGAFCAGVAKARPALPLLSCNPERLT